MVTIDINNSSSIRQIKYDHNRKELYVSYRDTGLYIYERVPDSLFDSIKAVILAEGSVGSFVSKHVRDRFTYRQPGFATVLQFPSGRSTPPTFTRPTTRADRSKLADDRAKRNAKILADYKLKKS